MTKLKDISLERALEFIRDAWDVRHFGTNRDAKPDLLLLAKFADKARTALLWTRNASCDCGKIDNETGICPICEALNLWKVIKPSDVL